MNDNQKHKNIGKSFAYHDLFHPLSSLGRWELPSPSDTDNLVNCFAQGHTGADWARPYICKKKWPMIVLSTFNVVFKVRQKWGVVIMRTM